MDSSAVPAASPWTFRQRRRRGRRQPPDPGLRPAPSADLARLRAEHLEQRYEPDLRLLHRRSAGTASLPHLDRGDAQRLHLAEDLPRASDGAYWFRVLAVSRFGAESEVIRWDWNVDTIAPTVRIDSGPSGTVSTDSAVFTSAPQAQPHDTVPASIRQPSGTAPHPEPRGSSRALSTSSG